jgi:hypothetical protein
MEEEKNLSQNVTNDDNFGLTKGDLRVYDENLNPVDWDNYPKITVSMGEDLEKYQKGMIRIDIARAEDVAVQSYWIQVDGLMSIVYSVYAKTLNDLRRATIRQQTIRMWGFFRKLFDKLRG